MGAGGPAFQAAAPAERGGHRILVACLFGNHQADDFRTLGRAVAPRADRIFADPALDELRFPVADRTVTAHDVNRIEPGGVERTVVRVLARTLVRMIGAR